MKNKTKDIIVILLGLSLLAYLFSSTMLVVVVLLLLLAVLLSDKAIDVILYAWHKIAQVLGFVNTRIILFLFYFIIITPYSRLMKLFNKNKMQTMGENTQFVESIHAYTAADFENMW